MSRRFIGRRGPQGDDWRWDTEQPVTPARPKHSSPRSAWQGVAGGVGSVAAAISTGLAKARRRLSQSRAGVTPSASVAPPRATGSTDTGVKHAPTLPLLKLAAVRISEDVRSPLIVITVLVLSAVLAVGMAVAIAMIGDDGDGPSGAVADLTERPPETDDEEPTEPAAVTPAPTSKREPTPEPTVMPTREPTPVASRGPLSLAFWSGERWQDAAGGYGPGDSVPFIIRWEGTPGKSYNVEIAYECKGENAPGIDFLSGLDGDDEPALLEAVGRTRPDSAVPLAGGGVLLLFGGRFTLLPATPGEACKELLTMRVPITATSGNIALLGAARIRSDAAAGEPLDIEVKVGGVGSAETTVGG